MQRIAFRMKLFQGFEEEYKKRHDELWPELKTLLKNSGIEKYSIFFDETTHDLIGFYNVTDPETLNNIQSNPVMKKWWSYMKDIMETNPDHSPKIIPLREVFYMP